MKGNVDHHANASAARTKSFPQMAYPLNKENFVKQARSYPKMMTRFNDAGLLYFLFITYL